MIQELVHLSPKKPYTLPLKQTNVGSEGIRIHEKAEIMVHGLSPLASPIIVVPKNHNLVNHQEKGCVWTTGHEQIMPFVTKAYPNLQEYWLL